MKAPRRVPVALTVAGSDSGGGAGIQADLKTFAALGVHGTSALTCLTAQNPRRVLAIEATSPKLVRSQLDAITVELQPSAVKTGMLYSNEIIRIFIEWFSSQTRLPLVVDPVMVSTSRASLLRKDALRILMDQLLPLCTVVTPNLDEAMVLSEKPKLNSVEDLRRAARDIHQRYGCAVLAKGGHLRGGKEAVDIFYDGQAELLLQAPFVPKISTHGTGCTYSAAVAAFLARGFPLSRSVRQAKEYISNAISNSYRIGKHHGLNHLFS